MLADDPQYIVIKPTLRITILDENLYSHIGDNLRQLNQRKISDLEECFQEFSTDQRHLLFFEYVQTVAALHVQKKLYMAETRAQVEGMELSLFPREQQQKIHESAHSHIRLTGMYSDIKKGLFLESVKTMIPAQLRVSMDFLDPEQWLSFYLNEYPRFMDLEEIPSSQTNLEL